MDQPTDEPIFEAPKEPLEPQEQPAEVPEAPPAPGPAESPRASAGEVALLFVVIIAMLFGWWYAQRPARSERDRGTSDVLQTETMARYALSAGSTSEPFFGKSRLSPWKRTEQAYRQALSVNPRMPRARRGLAATLYLEGDRAGAKAVMEEPVEIPPGGATVWQATQAAYGARPKPASPTVLGHYRKALQNPALGWSRYVALQALAINPSDAARWNRQMRAEYGRDPVPLVILTMLGVFVFLPAGIAILGRYINNGPYNQLSRLTVPGGAVMGAFLVGFVVYQLPTVLIAMSVGRKELGASAASGLLLNVTAMLTGGILVYASAAAILRNAGGGLKQLGWRTHGALRWAIGGYLALIPLLLGTLIVVSVLVALFPKVQTPSNPAAGMAAGASGWQIALVFVLACIIAPLVEELLFRGLLFRTLSMRYGPLVGALASTLIFAGLHPQLPFGFPPLFVIGLGLCVIYRSSGSLVPGMIVHGLNNTLALVVVRVLMGHVG